MTTQLTPPRYDKDFHKAMTTMDTEDDWMFTPEEVRDFIAFMNTLSFGKKRREARARQRQQWWNGRKGCEYETR